jgi:hypothetical protein
MPAAQRQQYFAWMEGDGTSEQADSRGPTAGSPETQESRIVNAACERGEDGDFQFNTQVTNTAGFHSPRSSFSPSLLGMLIITTTGIVRW